MSLLKQFEIWKRIDDFPSYAVSDRGRIIIIKKTGYKKVGDIKSTKVDKHGYLVTNFTKDGKIKTKFVHQLVTEAFYRKPKQNLEVNHIDGNRKNNNLNNLEYTTHSQNIKHGYDLGLKVGLRGPRNSWTKLSVNNVREIRKLLNMKELKHREIAQKYGVGRTCIKEIANNRNWAWLT